MRNREREMEFELEEKVLSIVLARRRRICDGLWLLCNGE